MKKERYIVEIEMPDGDSASSTWVRDTLQGEDEGRWKVSTSVMQNPDWGEWDEEDEKMIRALISICDEWATRHSCLPKEDNDIEKIKSWLKSLKDRYAWKPTGEQILALKYHLNNTYNESWQYAATEQLLNDLKKLL